MVEMSHCITYPTCRYRIEADFAAKGQTAYIYMYMYVHIHVHIFVYTECQCTNSNCSENRVSSPIHADTSTDTISQLVLFLYDFRNLALVSFFNQSLVNLVLVIVFYAKLS